MSENTKLWNILGRTDPKHTKQFTRGGGFKGTAIKPMWSYSRMTEEFGPCGSGWGVNPPEFNVQDCGDERLVFCTASIWYGTREQVCYGVGGDKVVAKFSSGGAKTDDEAFKKAYTDAITNALKMIGVGADVHMGLFDDNKYVNTMRDEFADEPAPRQPVSDGVRINKQTGMASSASLKESGVWNEFQQELLECNTVSLLTKLAMAWSAKSEKDLWPAAWRNSAKEEINKRRDVILNGPSEQSDFPGDPGYISTIQAG